MNFQVVRRVFGRHLRDDEGLYIAYLAQVAMALADMQAQMDVPFDFAFREIREAAAHRILQTLFGDILEDRMSPEQATQLVEVMNS